MTRQLAIVLLILLILLVAIPFGMGMAMGCPIHAAPCSATVGMCAATLGIFTLLVVTMLGTVRDKRSIVPALLFVTSLDRPPRLH